MSYSLNEIDALCRKAARGAGCDWGQAEDAGKAARWLQSYGLPGADSLLRCLDQRDDVTALPAFSGNTFRGEGPLCPLLVGASLSDHASLLAGAPLTAACVHIPLLLAPFAAGIVRQTHRRLRLQWPGVTIDLFPEGATFSGPHEAMLCDEAPSVTCTRLDETGTAQPPSHTRARLTPGIYHRLDTYAQRTYAPATEVSRAAGAGAGLTDND